ncbi:hypothetical protein NM208_g2761 [Fusarium decemcellulare]|uniref:Uncharacterized protein n=1 Tax=Fusarium decemcellulare TaxID=57161 RepID=A0ACC1SRR4_9HYPO|nr:hypothetical protein NM208_g2761 [Fusarium decemcellulare]
MPDADMDNGELLYQGIGITDWGREETFACAQVGDISAKMLWTSSEEWNAQLSTIHQWASTKVVASAPQSSSRQLYRPIRDPYEIRVLRINPGRGDDKLQGTLHHCSAELVGTDQPYRWVVSMDDFTTPVCYTALSYCWGPPEFEASIVCDGHDKKITKSLAAALRRLRQPDRSIVMWVDQICINQDDTTEKAQQIPLMERIYARALTTVIWLGEGTTGSDTAMQLLDKINAYLQFTFAEMKPETFEEIGLPPDDCKSWEELWKLFSREWFSRVWIIQETLLPPKRTLWVACGKSLLLWEILEDACIHLLYGGISRWLNARFPAEDGKGLDVCDRVVTLGAMRGDVSARGTSFSSIFSLLCKTRNAQCSDPRDRVYGLLGVCRVGERTAVNVSYAKECTAAGLYRDLVSRYVEDKTYRVGPILAYVDHESPDLPSWVPDWRVDSRMVPLAASWAQGIYSACGRHKDKVLHDIESRDRGELCVQGVLVDSIVKIGDLMKGPELSYKDPATSNKTLLDCINFAAQLRGAPPGDTVFNAFWHTIVAGKDGNGQLKSPTSFAEIFSLLLDELTSRSPSLPGQTYSVRQTRPKGKGRLELENLSKRAPSQTFQEIRTAMKRALKDRRLGITQKGYLGLFPQRAKEGDDIYVLENCVVPFVMRPAEHGNLQLVGECYVYGIMEGEAVEAKDIILGKIVLV